VKRTVLVALGVASVACAVGPNYKRPSTPVITTFRGQDRAEASSFADLPWWEVCGDPALVALINEALQNSYDLQEAVARVEVARQNARISTDALLPSVAVQAAPSYQQVFRGAISGLNLPNIPKGNVKFPLYQLQGTLSWEIDLWGRLRRLRESALAQFLASEQNRRGVIVSLVGEIAQAYYTLLALDLQLAVAHRTVATREETLTLFQKRERGDVGSALETASQAALLAGARATIPDLERQIAQAENHLAYVLGRTPGPIRRAGDLRSFPAPRNQPLGLPASLLERRPDVREAEARVMSANAEVGAALAAILPQLTFNANGGVESSSLPHLFTSNAVTFLFGGLLNGVVPFLNGAQNVHRYQSQTAIYVAAVVDYRRTVLGALRDVSDALVALNTYREARVALEAQVAAQVESVRLAQERFVAGVASYLDVVQAEQNLFPTELTLAQTIGAEFSSVIQLYRALGGGWQVPSAPGTKVGQERQSLSLPRDGAQMFR
jgi:outer membrane protein, multidrug efflux system